MVKNGLAIGKAWFGIRQGRMAPLQAPVSREARGRAAVSATDHIDAPSRTEQVEAAARRFVIQTRRSAIA
jgi:hypothetical protein